MQWDKRNRKENDAWFENYWINVSSQAISCLVGADRIFYKHHLSQGTREILFRNAFIMNSRAFITYLLNWLECFLVEERDTIYEFGRWKMYSKMHFLRFKSVSGPHCILREIKSVWSTINIIFKDAYSRGRR
ncbi:hypothetical protein NC652_034975 [Populus alba x Populus x berolinensis]|nr:hypothetical protein NC652_034975 [Populus alba x Populus x berolinensis]